MPSKQNVPVLPLTEAQEAELSRVVEQTLTELIGPRPVLDVEELSKIERLPLAEF